MLVATVVAVVVLWHVQLGYWRSGTDGQNHLGVLGSRGVAAVMVLAGVQQSGAGWLDRPTGTAVTALLAVSMVAIVPLALIVDSLHDLAVSGVAVAIVARVQEDWAQMLATAITGTTSNDLYGTIIATGSGSSAGSSSTVVLTMSIAGDLTVSMTVAGTTISSIAAGESQGANENGESLSGKTEG